MAVPVSETYIIPSLTINVTRGQLCVAQLVAKTWITWTPHFLPGLPKLRASTSPTRRDGKFFNLRTMRETTLNPVAPQYCGHVHICLDNMYAQLAPSSNFLNINPFLLVLPIYDYFLTFSAEVICIWQRPFSGGTFIFALNRYLPFCWLLFFVFYLGSCPDDFCSCVKISVTIGMVILSMLSMTQAGT